MSFFSSLCFYVIPISAAAAIIYDSIITIEKGHRANKNSGRTIFTSNLLGFLRQKMENKREFLDKFVQRVADCAAHEMKWIFL